jgi:protease I
VIVMSQELEGVRVAFVVANEGVERAELVEPWDAVVAAGGQAFLAAPKSGPVRLFEHLDRADTRPAGLATTELQADQFDALVLPGGVANADELRTDAAAVRFVADMARAGAPIGVICHGPWTLIEAGAVRGRTLTSWPSLRTDIVNAGGRWVDEVVHVDGNLISSRKPHDLPAFCREIVTRFAS